MKIRDDDHYVLISRLFDSARAMRLEQSDDAPSLWVKSDFPESCAISCEIDVNEVHLDTHLAVCQGLAWFAYHRG
jgi:hypothetical protein